LEKEALVRGRVFVTIPGVVLAITMIFVGGSAVNASTFDPDYDPQEECTSRAWNIWAENCDGWHVTIENTLDAAAQYYQGNVLVNDASTGVYEAPESITKRSNATILGKESTSGGPTNMFIVYNTPELAQGYLTGFAGNRPYKYPYSWRRFVDVKSTITGKTTVKCGVFRTTGTPVKIKQKEYVGCDVVKTTPNEPISVRFTDPGEGPWKQ
jgi:hypothetical protein